MASPRSQRNELLRRLKGQTIRAPDLAALFPHWPQTVNDSLPELDDRLHETLCGLATSNQKLAILKKAQFGLFAASWWPTATPQSSYIVMCLAIWLFIWDDEIDQSDGRLSSDLGAAQRFRLETLRYIRHCLKLSSDPVPHPSSKIIAFFKIVGDAACEACSVEQRQLLMTEFEFFIETSRIEQERRLSDDLPTIAEYTACRMGTSAVNVTTFFNLYACNIDLPLDILDDADMRELWDKTNIIIWMTNDILSLKKEVARNEVDSILPLLYQEHGSVEIAVANIVQAIADAIVAFDLLAAKLVQRYPDEGGRVAAFIEACRYNCTGNLYWSLRTGRYGVTQESISGGDCVITLE